MKYRYIFFLMFLSFIFIHSCKKTPLTCLFSGEVVQETIILSDFDTVEVNHLIQLSIIHSNENKLIIKTDKDVLQNIEYQIINGKLILKNNTNCLVQNSQAIAFMTLYVDDINCIIANTDLDVNSGNVWNFNELKIICENAAVGNNNIADFDINVNINQLKIIANGSSIFKISGFCQNLFVGFYGVNPFFMGKNLEAQHISVFHRGSGDMHLFPIESLSGDHYGYGDIYIYRQPQIYNLTSHYAGHIYFVN